MKIVHVFKDFYPPLAAGITCYIADVSEAMARRGHQVEVHVAGVKRSRRDRLPSGVVVHRHREVTRALSMPLAPGLVREVRSVYAHVIHVHLPNPIAELGVVLNRTTPIVCTFHAQLGRQQIFEPVYAPLREALLTRAASILVSGEKMASAPELRHHRDKVTVLPYGVSPRLTCPQPGRSRSADDALRLLFVGRLVYYKGVDILLRALTQVPDVHLRIVGDGANRFELERLASELLLEQRVTFTGLLDDAHLLREYQGADVFVLPSVSRAEAFGLAMVEAMANGLPAISTSLGTGTDWVNLDGVSGLVVAPGDASALAQAIERLRDPSLRQTLSVAAQERVKSNFSFAAHADALEHAYLQAAS